MDILASITLPMGVLGSTQNRKYALGCSSAPQANGKNSHADTHEALAPLRSWMLSTSRRSLKTTISEPMC